MFRQNQGVCTTESTDWELVQACRADNEAAWDIMLNRYQRWVFFVPRRYGLTDADAADIVQITYTIMMDNLHVFHAESNIKAWLGTVAKRQTWLRLKKHDREDVYYEEDLSDSALLMSKSGKPQDTLALADWLHDGLGRLGEKCRTLLLALYLEDTKPSYDDISNRFGMSVGSIGPTRARCLKKLKEIMNEIG